MTMLHYPVENTILLADPDDGLLAMIEQASPAAIEIVHIKDAQETMRYLREHKPKLVLAADKPKQVSGKHIINGMRFTRHLKDVKAVLVTQEAEKNFKFADYTLQEPLEQAMIQDILERTFHLTLNSELVEAAKQSEAEARNKHILIVEDSPAVIALLQHILSREGFDVTGVKSVAEAKALLTEESAVFDLLLLDINLQGGSGVDILKFMQDRLSIPSIILSALQNQASIDESLELGAREFIPKPFDPRDLLNSIRMNIA